MNLHPFRLTLFVVFYTLASSTAFAHGIHGPDRDFIEASTGLAPAAFMYLGAKHMITGYDHLLYLAGVVFFLRNFRDVATLVSLFALGHSITLLFGVLANVNVNPYLVDALIGFSVVYKAYENLNTLNDKQAALTASIPYAVFAFGLIHGFGLATKLQEFTISKEGLVSNIISFNIGVEIGQIIALAFILMAFNFCRRFAHFDKFSSITNWLIMIAGFTLIGFQLSGYFYA